MKVVLRVALVTGLLAVLVVASAVTTQAKELTLDDCIEQALKNRYSVIRARGEETRASANKRAALGAFLPGLSASYSYSKSKRIDYETDVDSSFITDVGIDSLSIGSVTAYDASYSIGSEVIRSTFPDVETTNKSLGIDASMWLFRLPNFYNYFGARSDKLVAHLDVINSEQDLIFSVKTRYYLYLAAIQNIQVQEEAVKRSEEQLKLNESKYELGSASLSDVLKQKVQYGNDRLSLISAQNAVADAKSELAYTIGINPHSDIEFSTDYNIRQFDGSLEEALQFGLEHEPGLLALEQTMKSSGYAVNSRKAEYLPTLSAFAGYSKNEGTSGFDILRESASDSRSFGFRASWNIFDGFNRERNLSSAKVTRNNSAAQYFEARNFLLKEIKTAYLELEKLREQKMVSDENVAAAEEDLKITQEKYNLGAATILDLLNAQVSVKQAQVSLVQVDFDLNTSIARLENAMGKM
ncbi:MAG: TolC family protein [bacterium]|nr:TolC family protein [bacterium]